MEDSRGDTEQFFLCISYTQKNNKPLKLFETLASSTIEETFSFWVPLPPQAF